MSPRRIAEFFIRSTTDKAAEAEFHNQKLGQPHAVDGAKLTDDDINKCMHGYKREELPPQTGLVTLGVDVGTWLHYEIDDWTLPEYVSGTDLSIYAQCRTLTFGKVKTFEELDLLMLKWGVRYCVIDAQPESRKAIEFRQPVLRPRQSLLLRQRRQRPDLDGQRERTVCLSRPDHVA